MNKKVLALGLSAAMVAALGLTACGGNQASESSSAAASNASSAATQTHTQTQSSTAAQPSSSASSANQPSSAQSTSPDAAEANGTLSYKGTSEDGKYQVSFIDEVSSTSEVGTVVITNTTTGEEKTYSGDLTWTMTGAESHGKIMGASGDTLEFDTVADDDLNIYFVFDECGKVKMEMDSVNIPTQTDGAQSSTSQSDTSQPANK